VAAVRHRPALTGERLGIVAATIYLFNPGTIFNSAVWGQIDSVGTLVLLATIYALARGWTEAAALGAVVALLVKFQFAFLVPVVAAVGLKRHLWGRSSDPGLARRDPLRVLTSLAVGVVSLTVLMLPFGMVLYTPLAGGDPRGLLGILPEPDPSRSLIGKFIEAAGTYTGLSVNAFSMWRNPWSGLGDTLHWGDDTAVVLSLAGVEVTWQLVGTLLFAVAAIVAIWIAVKRDDLRGVLLASLVLAIAFFVLPTRVHERYLFPALALAAPLVLSGRAWPWVYGGLSLVFFANVYWVYTADWSFAGRIITPGRDGLPMERDPLLAATLFTDWGIWLVSGLGLALLLAVGWLALRIARERRSVTEWDDVPRDLPSRAPSTQAAAVGGAASEPEAAGGGGPAWLRRNPADAYLREPWGRFDRRDAIILLALVVFALVFRLWRLDVPRGHHFDEVYHARSAAEFLGSWQHGWDRDVYEWTHPMLAKYLIAGGIMLADPNAVVSTRPLDGPASGLAVAPRRAADGRDRSIVFTVSPPSTVVAADAASGEEIARWGVGGQVASLGYDPDGLRLLVGRADGGRVDTYELAGLLASPSVIGIVMPRSDGAPTLLRGPDGLVAVDAATDEILGRIDGRYAGAGYVLASGEAPARVALSVSGRDELLFVDAETMAESSRVRLDVPLLGPLVLRGDGDDQQLFALTGPLPAGDGHDGTDGGVAVLDADGRDGRCADEPCLIGLAPLPGSGTVIAVHPPTSVIVVAGTADDGSAELWTLTRHFERRGDGTIGLAAFDSTPLPGTPLAMAYDVATTAQDDDRARLFVSTADAAGAARLVEIDAGANGFAWRLAGVIAGSLLVGLVYLLGATMFSRRRIAVLAAAFVAVDGMSYAMSRIAMNDIFVALFIVAAYLVFWQVWSGRWSRSAWWALPLTGVLIGLAAASKWVGFYALAGLLVLVLARSGLGRLLLVGLVALATVIGGVGAPWPFTVVMIGILAVALAIGWARPIRIDISEALSALPATAVVLTGTALAFVLAYDTVEASDPSGPIEYVFSLLARGAEAGWPAWLMIGAATVLIAWRAIRSLRDPDSDARWYRPGEMGGFAWSWVGACLVVVPLVVYGLTYLPYLALGHEWATPGGPGYGWSVDQLHRQMYGYHFNLTAGHASASPWWSWPLALKPVWFFNGTYDGDQIAVIYNSGNPLLFWAGIPALAACAVLAWKRRSAALVLLVAAFAFQYVPWIRIERATFAYHYLTAVIFAMVAVAYVVDELLRRPAWRQLTIGYLALAGIVGLLIFPLGAALPMPDWYINAARALPPWNYAFQFPDPPSGDRGELIATGALTALLGLVAAVVAAWFALSARPMWERRRRARAAGDSAWPTAPADPESG
jgi:predicted membrane-bound dolichyl-phosphate-mannose-protein mannosyltransferase